MTETRSCAPEPSVQRVELLVCRYNLLNLDIDKRTTITTTRASICGGTCGKPAGPIPSSQDQHKPPGGACGTGKPYEAVVFPPPPPRMTCWRSVLALSTCSTDEFGCSPPR